MNPPYLTTVWIAHLLAAYLILVAPWLSRIAYRKAQRDLQNDPRAKARLFRRVVAKQIVLIAIILGLWLFGGIRGEWLGIRAPHSWPLTGGLTAVILVAFAWSAIRMRPKATQFREKLKNRVGLMLPATPDELRWFAIMATCGGIAEELLCRGFLFYYFRLYIPHINDLELALLTALFFGLAHFYQGKWGVLGTGVAGAILAALYVGTGSLLLPAITHITGNLRAVVVFWPGEAPAELAPGTGTA